MKNPKKQTTSKVSDEDLVAAVAEARERVSKMSKAEREALLDQARLQMHPVPEWKKPPIPIPVQALREFMSRFGQDVSVLVTWTHEEPNSHQFLTIGSDRLYAEAAVRMRNEISEKMNLTPGTLNEDLRQDHSKIDLTAAQIDFLLWLLGRALGESDRMLPGHRQLIEQHHDRLFKILGDAKEKSARAGDPVPK